MPECTAEHRLSNRNRLTGTRFSSQGCLLQQSCHCPDEYPGKAAELSLLSSPGCRRACSKAGCPGGEQPSQQARDRDRPRVGLKRNKVGQKQTGRIEAGEKKIKGTLTTSSLHVVKEKQLAKIECLSQKEHLHTCTPAVRGQCLQRK